MERSNPASKRRRRHWVSPANEPLFREVIDQAIFQGRVDELLERRLAVTISHDRVLRARMRAILAGDPAMRRCLPLLVSSMGLSRRFPATRQGALHV